MTSIKLFQSDEGWIIEATDSSELVKQQKSKFSFLQKAKKLNLLDKLIILTTSAVILIPQVNDKITALVQTYLLVGRVQAFVTPANMGNYSADQQRVITEYIRAGRDMKASNHKIITALTITAQESGYRSLIPGKTCNLDRGECNDDWYFAQWGERSDSFGTRQGRLSSGYQKSCMLDPYCTAKTIYQEFKQIPNADSLPYWQLAAKVQRPAKEYEYHYQYHAVEAEKLLAANSK